jgi:hypothetical protein
MKARGSKGPEALSPWQIAPAQVAGKALTAALGNDWERAKILLLTLSEDELETLGSVAKRFAERVWAAEIDKWNERLPVKTETVIIADRERALDALGLGTCDCGDHPERMWLTRAMVHCPHGHGWGRTFFPTLNAKVEAVRPKVHCWEWRPGDPEDRFHGANCLAKRRRSRFIVIEGDS